MSKFTKHKNVVLVYLYMYAKSQHFKVFEPNTKVKNKFYKFLDICRDLLEHLDNNNYKYVVIIPYSAKLDYNTDNSRYEYSITYAIINNTEPIKKRNIHKSPYVVFKKNTDKDFADEIRKALDLKGKQRGVVLVSDYPLYEQLNRELRQEVESNTIGIKSIYTIALYYHIVNTLKKGEQVGEAGLTDVCVKVSSGGKVFSRRENEDSSNLMVCNTTAATIAGIRKNDAIATVDLEPELVEGINITTGVPINGSNVVLTNAEYIIASLQLLTHKSFSSKNEMQNTKQYGSNVQKTNTVDDEKQKIYKLSADIFDKAAKIFFADVPDEGLKYENVFHEKFLSFLLSFEKFLEPVQHLAKTIQRVLTAPKYTSMLDDPNGVLAEAVRILIKDILPYSPKSFNPPTNIKEAIDPIVINILQSPKINPQLSDQMLYKLNMALPYITLLFYVFVYYGASEYLTPKNTWGSYVKDLRELILRIADSPLKEVIKNRSNATSAAGAGSSSATSAGSSSTTSAGGSSTTGAGGSSTAGAGSSSTTGATKSTVSVHILKKKQFVDCHLYDRDSAVKYCMILLNGDADTNKHINSYPLKTILDILGYLSAYSNGIFSNIDQITKINESNIPEIPINFNKYDIENLMLLTCDQNIEAIPLIERQARIDSEFVSNNVALDIVNDQFNPASNEYYFNMIIFKRRELKIDEKMIDSLKKLVEDFGEMVSKKVNAMAFVKNSVDISNVLSKYKFTGSVILIDDDPSQTKDKLNKTLGHHSQYCFNLVYMIDDHQHLHEMHIPGEEIEKYVDKDVNYEGIKIPLTSYLNYVLEYTLYYRNSQNQQNLSYPNVTRYRVLVNEMSIKMDFARLLSYTHLLFDIPKLNYTTDDGKKDEIDVLDVLTKIQGKAINVRTVSFSNKPYTVSLEPIKRFISNVKDKKWYKVGFHRCNPNRKRILEEYYEASASYYENFLKSEEYKDHAHKIINGCQTPGVNVMSDRVGRVYVSILKPYEFKHLSGSSSSANLYFDKLNQAIDNITNRIDGLYISFSDKIKTHDTPEIDYNIETDVVRYASAAKGKTITKDKLKFLDKLDLEYVERIAYIMTVYMTMQMRWANQADYPTWLSTLAPIFSQKDAPKLIIEQIPDFDEVSYDKAFNFSKFFNLTSTEFVLMILTSRYLSYLYSNKDQDIVQAFRGLVKDIITTTASEASTYRIQMLIAGIRMFLQNFICDLYSNSGGRDFMDANKFSGSYLIICEDSDLATALASSISILLRFKGKTDKSLKEIETLSRQFYSNVFKTIYKKNNKWYKRVIHNIVNDKKDKYYNEELSIVEQTLNMMIKALDIAENFITSSTKFDKNYPLYGLAALAFVLAIPMTLSLAVSLGERDNTNSMHGLVYRYQDTMSAYGITLSNRYCSAGYGMGELEWPEDTKMSQLIDFPVSTNIIKPENIFDRDNYNEAIITISEVLSHRAKNMNERLGQIIVTDDYTRLAIDMNNVNTIIILSGRRNTLSQAKIQNTRILSEKVAWELYDQTNRKANVYYVAFEYDDRVQHIIHDTYLKENLKHNITYARLGLNQSINNLYSVMSQVQSVQTGTSGGSTTQQASQFNPIVLTIAIT